MINHAHLHKSLTKQQQIQRMLFIIVVIKITLTACSINKPQQTVIQTKTERQAETLLHVYII